MRRKAVKVRSTKDVAKRQKAVGKNKLPEQALHDTEERFRAVLENMSEGVMLFDKEENLFYQNPASLKIHGFSRPEEGTISHEKLPVTWKAWDETGRPIRFEEWPVSRVFRGERFHGQVLRVIRVETGQEFYASYNGCPIYDAEGKLSLGFITIRETTEFHARQALQNSERRLRTFFESDMVGAIYWNMDGKITGANEKFLKMIGYTREEVLSGGVSWSELTPPEYRHLDERAIEQLRTTGVDTPYEKEYIRKDGSRVPIIIGAAMLDERRFEGVAFVLDVTDRRRAEDAVRQSEERYRALVTATSDVVYRMSPDWAEMQRLDPDTQEADRDWFEKYIAPEDRNRVKALIQNAVSTKSAFGLEHRVLRADGTPGWMFSRAVPRLNTEGEIIEWCGTATDITERKRAEQALRESEERYRTLFESIDEGFCTVEVIFDENNKPVDYIFLAVNPTFERQTGIRNAVGRRMRNIAPLHEENWFRIYGDVALTGRPRRFEQPAKQLDRFYDVYAYKIGSEGERKVAVLFNDITERKKAEQILARDREELERLVAERTAELRDLVGELEHFSYSITHDMRAPLRAMMGFTEVLKDLSAEGLHAQQQEFLERIANAARRMDLLITDALNYSKAVRNELPLAPVDVGRLLRGMVDTYPELQHARNNIHVDRDLPLVMGNEAGLTQCFSNLLLNAVKFADPDRDLVVRVYAERRERFVRMWVEDNGIGIEKNMLRKVFDMFSKGKGAKAGTGIGLALVRKVAHRMGGKVGVESKEGEGSRFWVELEAGE